MSSLPCNRHIEVLAGSGHGALIVLHTLGLVHNCLRSSTENRIMRGVHLAGMFASGWGLGRHVWAIIKWAE